MKKVITIFFVLIIVILLFHQHYVPIRKIDCFTQYGPCSDSVNQKLSNLNGQRLGDISKQLKRDFALSESAVRVESVYKFPATALVYLEQKKGEIAVKINEQRQYVVLDQDGNKIGISQESQLPVLEVKTYEPDWEKIKHASLILSNIYYWNGLKKASMDNEKMIVNQREVDFYFPLDGDLDYQLGSYSLLLSWLNSEHQEIKIRNEGYSNIVMDLRYNNPIMKYE